MKKDIDEIETINIELKHRVAKLVAKNEHLKQTYKQLYDLIKPSRVHAKERVASLVNQLNQKSVEIIDLNAQLQEKETHIYYLKHTMEQAAILKEIVEQAKLLNPLDSASYSSCKYVKLIQELLGYVRDTCLDIHKPSEKLVVVMPINKKKIVRSKSIENTKNDRILQISSSKQKKNKVEDHSRIVKSCLNKPNSVVELSGNENVYHSKLNKNSKLMRLKVPKNNGSNSKPKIAKSMISNKKEPGTSRGSNTSVAPSSTSLFDLSQFYESDLEVAFRKHTCFVCNLEGVDLLSGSRETNLYTLSIGDMIASSQFISCPKPQDQILVMAPTIVTLELWKKYILVIMNDYSWFTWVKFLASKDEAPDFIIKFMKMIQVRLNVTVRNIHTDNGTAFVNQNLRTYYESVGISHETSVARTPQQNGVVERRNLTLVEAARTMSICAKGPLFLWAEAVVAACYTQNRSIIRCRHRKTPYELLHDRKLDLSYLHVFGALCYPNNDSEDLGKL
uniref:Retrovirus-related Pol polyprotein from transposon TNT 1-94 n=1 Tax=Tanacetum cinerariifolium TaxID=118510 RepID=A0A6L2NDK5_TANCI|nr:retrovirus-related Pol polyprotein from transposon TNT 1-94 [Tanacetum cinerariifolium]